MEAMNRPAVAVVREDGYRQDKASQLAVEAVLALRSRTAGGHSGEWILDVCSCPLYTLDAANSTSRVGCA